MAQTEATRNRLDALTMVAAACASLFVAVGGYIINQHGQRLDAQDTRTIALEISYATIMEHVGNHEKTAAHWISVIKEGQQKYLDLALRINRLETRSSARPDAFTGAEGKVFGKMISELQRQQKQQRLLLEFQHQHIVPGDSPNPSNPSNGS